MGNPTTTLRLPNKFKDANCLIHFKLYYPLNIFPTHKLISAFKDLNSKRINVSN